MSLFGKFKWLKWFLCYGIEKGFLDKIWLQFVNIMCLATTSQPRILHKLHFPLRTAVKIVKWYAGILIPNSISQINRNHGFIWRCNFATKDPISIVLNVLSKNFNVIIFFAFVCFFALVKNILLWRSISIVTHKK